MNKPNPRPIKISQFHLSVQIPEIKRLNLNTTPKLWAIGCGALVLLTFSRPPGLGRKSDLD